jgi:steroid 5-alpha reductase family enzyme
VPILGAYYYQTRNDAEYVSARAWISMSILWLWAIRLTHNYLRREEWMLGEQEDWRLAAFRK